jgi:indole-3-glycerol phosphate synthase
LFLETILASKKAEVAERARERPLTVLERAAAEAGPCRPFLEALQSPGLSVIAEIKRASPSKGPIRADLDPASLARQYEAGGCACVSVLTDLLYFGAREKDLPSARAAVSVPVLRKDFLLAEYQLWESRAMGADAVLLIVAALEPRRLETLIRLSADLGMSQLVEVHDEAELRTALDAGATIIGVNNRDLRSFQVDLETTRRLMPMLPSGVTSVSESGITGPREAGAVRSWGADALLVGESLVTSHDPVRLIRELRIGARSDPDFRITKAFRESGSVEARAVVEG